MKEQGYIKLARKSIKSDIWYKPPIYWKVWCYILMKVKFSDDPNLKKGEAIITYEELRESCSYYAGFRKVRPSLKQIRNVMDYLRGIHEGHHEDRMKVAMIVTTKVNKGMLVKVLNYAKYQTSENYEGHNEGQSRGRVGAQTGHTLYIKNDNKNEEEINNYIYNTSKKSVPTYMITTLPDQELATEEETESVKQMIEKIGDKA